MEKDLEGKEFWYMDISKLCNTFDLQYAHIRVLKQFPKNCKIKEIECNHSLWHLVKTEKLRECKPPYFKDEKSMLKYMRKILPDGVAQAKENLAMYTKKHESYSWFKYVHSIMVDLNVAINKEDWREALKECASKYASENERYFREALAPN